MEQVQDIINPPDRQVGSEQPRLATIVVSFVVSFAFACSLLLALGHYGLNAPRSLWPLGSVGAITRNISEDSAPFDSIQVNRGGVYAKASVGAAANPTKGESFALFVWFNLRKVPAAGESLGLVGKFDSQLPGKPGYAISLEGAPDGVRPRVYISAGDVAGRWYSFASHPMNRRDWYLLAVTVVEDAFIATSLGRALSSEPLRLLGGHRLGAGELPASDVDLVVGAFGASRFRGRIGPFGILSEPSDNEELSVYLRAIQEQPGVIPSVIPASAIRLWASPIEDRGPLKFPVVNLQGSREGDQNEDKTGAKMVDRVGEGKIHSKAAQVRPPVAKRGSKTLRLVAAPKKVITNVLKDKKKR